MNPNWRMWPLAANLMSGTMAIAVSSIASYPRITFCIGLACYAMAAYVIFNWRRRICSMRARGAYRGMVR